jgi:hypothetical protein
MCRRGNNASLVWLKDLAANQSPRRTADGAGSNSARPRDGDGLWMVGSDVGSGSGTVWVPGHATWRPVSAEQFKGRVEPQTNLCCLRHCNRSEGQC